MLAPPLAIMRSTHLGGVMQASSGLPVNALAGNQVGEAMSIHIAIESESGTANSEKDAHGVETGMKVRIFADCGAELP